jgi:multidrug efflux pump subunit AcrA (membrane-fusion protein)
MSTLTTVLPLRRAELIIRPIGERGRYVVKDPAGGRYFELGEEEHYLLTQLDGQRDATEICAAFERRFGQPLGEDELETFLQLAQSQALLDHKGATSDSGSSAQQSRAPDLRDVPQTRQSILYWRKSIFNPDQLFNWLAPKIRFFWTRGFFAFSAGCIVLATVVLWTNGHDLAANIQHALRLETLLWAWLVLQVATLLHEFAHGLTCKHYGGEVREIGFLLMFFMPCLYCNVSDAWLFREKRKRLWVTFAGGYFELFLWALAVLIWRLTVPGLWPSYLAFIVVASCGVGTLFNFNPLIKLDGYYMLSDWLEIPNLQERGVNRLKAHLRHLLWGAPRPLAEPRGRVLVIYGIISWLYMLAFLCLALAGMFWFVGEKWGVIGMSAVTLLGLVSSRALLKDVAAGEVRQMLSQRQKRLAVWIAVMNGLVAALCFVHMEDRASGKCQVRPVVRAEIRAPLAGFLREVHCDEGDRVTAGAPVARLEVPDLFSRLMQKQAEVRESQARLQLLEAGPRSEEVELQRERVRRTAAWRDLGQQELKQMQQALDEDLARLEHLTAQQRAELDAAQDALARAENLLVKGMITEEQYRETQKRKRVVEALLAQAQAEARARRSKGVLESDAELARREKEFAETKAALALLDAGTRPEEIEAERARLARLQVEREYLESLERKLRVKSPVTGLVSTARLREKLNQYFREGELICVVEEPAALEAEITLPEQSSARVEPGQAVAIKLRTLPYDSFVTHVQRISPAAASGDVQSQLNVVCRFDGAPAEVRPGMTGYARIYTGRRPIGAILLDRLMRFVRTEFWW